MVSAHPSRIWSLDALRGVAILLVIFHHVAPCPPMMPPVIGSIFRLLHSGGWIGVDLFFVLSGYLVSGLIFHEFIRNQSFSPFKFLVRRGFKIYPAFYVLLIATLMFHFPGNRTFPRIWGEIFFLQNYVGSVLTHTWSLAVEEHFYILLAFGLALLARKKTIVPFQEIRTTFLWMAPAILIFRIIDCDLTGPPYQTHWATHFRLDSLLFGVLLSWIYHFHQEKFVRWIRRYRSLLWIVAFITLSLPFMIFWTDYSYFINSIGFTILYVGSGCLLISVIDVRKSKSFFMNRSLTLLQWIGVSSYSIYLWHTMAIFFVAYLFHSDRIFFRWFGDQSVSTGAYLIYVISVLMTSIIGGYIASLMVERPFLKLRSKIMSR